MLCRVSTTGLLLLLTAAYPHLQLYFMLLVTLDLASHWYQMYATLAAGGITHKVQGSTYALLLQHMAVLDKTVASASCYILPVPCSSSTAFEVQGCVKICIVQCQALVVVIDWQVAALHWLFAASAFWKLLPCGAQALLLHMTSQQDS